MRRRTTAIWDCLLGVRLVCVCVRALLGKLEDFLTLLMGELGVCACQDFPFGQAR